MMQEWADCLDWLRAGEAPLGAAAVMRSQVSGGLTLDPVQECFEA